MRRNSSTSIHYLEVDFFFKKAFSLHLQLQYIINRTVLYVSESVFDYIRHRIERSNQLAFYRKAEGRHTIRMHYLNRIMIRNEC
jgi:hypothetical protein